MSPSLSTHADVPIPAQAPDPLRRAHLAPEPRTLVDVLLATAAAHPQAPALDDGETVLSYAALLEAIGRGADRLAAHGVRRGDRVGVRVDSGTAALHVAVLSVLAAGAAYVPVDADDPDERARVVFAEAAVVHVVTTGDDLRDPVAGAAARCWPRPADDAWVIFTSGSTGTPKGVAVTHRSAAAFVDAEARLFCRDAPLGPGDRVLAGLSVAFDASCEEMWLAWRHGACLVPAPRSLVRAGADLGPWLSARGITVVSTVPTLAALWSTESLADVRLLIFGGEACPPELVDRLVGPGREVWNTYGPTEATVVACASRLTGRGPVHIGLPLDGWDLAVVGTDQQPVPAGAEGELIIGGVGLARYLDPVKDAATFAAMPSLGWERAYRSGDLVRTDYGGLRFLGRADEQVKLGGRRIELGEVDAALAALPGVAGAAAAVRTTRTGNQVLVGYVVTGDGGGFESGEATARLREVLPAALVPLLAVLDALPTRTSGKVDRPALPWPLPRMAPDDGADHLTGVAGRVADAWTDVLGVQVGGVDDDFFAGGGGSLAAAQLVSVLRASYPEVTVADVYANPRLGDLAARVGATTASPAAAPRSVAPTPRRAGWTQTLLEIPLHTLVGLRWTTWLAALLGALQLVGATPWVPAVSWWWVLAGWVVLISPLGRMGITAAGARLLLRGLRPGSYPRGGGVHLRLWTAERLADVMGAENLSGAPWITLYARALGARVGRGVDLHSVPPVTGMLWLGKHASIEPEVDLRGHWLDGDVLHVGSTRVGAGATVGARSTLVPGARVGRGAEVGAGSTVHGRVPRGEFWSGSPAFRIGRARHGWPADRPPRAPGWVPLYGLASGVLACLPVLAVLAGLAVLGPAVAGTSSLGRAAVAALAAAPLAALAAIASYAVLVVIAARLLGIGVHEGHHPVRSRVGWQVWATERLLDDARTYLFPLYASLATPWWLRLLGARVGRGVEASTVLLVPAMTTIGDGAFLADDTMIGSYELGGGWLRVARASVGDRGFLGNSAVTAPGRAVPSDGLVAVLSATPKRADPGSSWLGSPPVQLRRDAQVTDARRTVDPPRAVQWARGAVEVTRVVPVICSVVLAIGVLTVLAALAAHTGWWWAGAASGVVLLVAGALAALLTSAAKWVLVGRYRVVEHPLWSGFVWRTELADTFVEMLAAPWFARAAAGTPAVSAWLRTMGASIGRGVWCESYWLPEADLVTVGDGASVNRGCVLQTHLFHDRIMSMDRVRVDAGGTVGPHGVVLPAAVIGPGTTVGPGSLVMRGEEVPAGSRWVGNPVVSWHATSPSDSPR